MLIVANLCVFFYLLANNAEHFLLKSELQDIIDQLPTRLDEIIAKVGTLALA